MEHVDNPDGLIYGEMVKRATTDHADAPLVGKFEAYPVKKMRRGIGLLKVQCFVVPRREVGGGVPET